MVPKCTKMTSTMSRDIFPPPPPPWDIKLGDVYFIKMFAFVVGVACGAQTFLYFTSKIKCSRYF